MVYQLVASLCVASPWSILRLPCATTYTHCTPPYWSLTNLHTSHTYLCPHTGNGASPAALTIEAVRAAGIKSASLPPRSALCATVPGAVAFWEAAVQQWGSGEVNVLTLRLFDVAVSQSISTRVDLARARQRSAAVMSWS